MEPLTHLMTGACMARAGFNRRAAYATLAMTLAAEVPDLDMIWRAGGPVAGFEHHRGITHTLLGVPFEGALLLGAIYALHRTRVRRAARQPPPAAAPYSATDEHVTAPLTAAPTRWTLLYGCILLALLSHILLDWTNNYGVRPFFPFNPRWYAGSIVFLFEPILFAALLLALVAPALFGLIAGEIGARRQRFRGRGWAISALVAMLALWGWRGMERQAALRLAATGSYGPATASTTDAPSNILRLSANPYPLNPWLWHVVVETPEYYQLATVDTRAETVSTTAADDIFFKPPTTLGTLLAKRSALGRVYLDWSSWPLVTDVGPVANYGGGEVEDPEAAPAGSTAVTFRDLRFLYSVPLMDGRRHPPLSGTVYIDADRHVERTEMNGAEQR